MKLLIVDDHDLNLRLLRAQLEAEGHEVLEASDGAEALAMLESASVDGIVSDILMPVMDGYKLCLEVRRHPRLRHLPIVLYTSTYNSPADRRLAETAGADAYISKPAQTQALIEALQSAAKSRRTALAPDATASAAELSPVLKQYSEALVRKLEERSLRLEHAQAGLVQVGARLSGLVETALDAIISVDDKQQVILFNSAAGRMFGCLPAEALGRPLDRFIPGRFRDDHRKMVQGFAAGASDKQRMVARTVTAVRSDGSEFPIDASISRMQSSDGQILTVFIRDVTQRLQAERALARSESQLRRAEDMAQLAHMVTGTDGRLLDRSPGLLGLLGVDPGEAPVDLAAWLGLVHEDDRGVLRNRLAVGADASAGAEFEYRLCKRGAWINVRHILEPMALEEGSREFSTFHALQDVTRQKQAEVRIARLSRVHAVLSGINNLIVRADSREALFRDACRIIVDKGQFPSAWIALLGQDGGLRVVASCGSGQPYLADLQARLADFANFHFPALRQSLEEGRPLVINDIAGDSRLENREALLAGGARSLAVLPLMLDGRADGLLSLHSDQLDAFDAADLELLLELANDISFALDHLANADRLRKLANYDTLTGLPNRRLFAERLAQRIQDLEPGGANLAVALIDIERFRQVNEILGRLGGDELLCMVAQRLAQAEGTAARIGVDLFAMKLMGSASADELSRDLNAIVDACFGKPFELLGQELRLGCRGGVAIHPADGCDAETLLRNADAAWRHARATSEHCVFYAPAMNAGAGDALSLESRLRKAIGRGEFVLHYQPKVGFADRRLCGVEALLRWLHPSRGLVPPMQFISLLEETGLISTVGRWALGQALADSGRWRAAGHALIRVAVNVSPLQFRQPDFAEHIAQLLHGGRGSALEVEITEGVIMDNVARAIATLGSIRELGVHVAIDDFGTGYSSLAYLAKLPITSLKIDRAFVTAMTDGPEGLAMVSSIIALAHALKLKVVAEGVETEVQAQLLRLLACDEAQGYLFCQPVPAAEIEAILARGCALPLPPAA